MDRTNQTTKTCRSTELLISPRVLSVSHIGAPDGSDLLKDLSELRYPPLEVLKKYYSTTKYEGDFSSGLHVMFDLSSVKPDRDTKLGFTPAPNLSLLDDGEL
jgi:hypothetical protein